MPAKNGSSLPGAAGMKSPAAAIAQNSPTVLSTNVLSPALGPKSPAQRRAIPDRVSPCSFKRSMSNGCRPQQQPDAARSLRIGLAVHPSANRARA
jgi:hypothetical protein